MARTAIQSAREELAIVESWSPWRISSFEPGDSKVTGQHWQLAFPGPPTHTTSAAGLVHKGVGSFATTSSLECAMPSSGKARCPPLSGRMSSGAENRGCGIAHEPSAHVTPLAPDLPGCGTLRLTLGMRSSSQFCPAALTCPHPKESQPSSNFLLLVFSLVALLS